ncbi:MAG: LysM peptidoglycan-binding domain-containing protein [Pseudomonadota bacterium]
MSVQSAPAPQATEAAHHLVVEGDTLYGLSRRYGLSLSELQQANGLDGAAIALGQTLTIPQKAADPNRMVQPAAQPQTPKSAVYAVAPKDSLYAISRRTCVAVADIAAANGLSSPFILQPGQRLQLPSGHCLSR